MSSLLRSYARGPVLTAPGPRSGEMLRSFRDIRTDPLGFLLQMRSAHGPLVQFPVPVPPSYFASDVGDVRRVLVDNARAYDKHTMQYRGLAALTGDGLLTADGSVWREARKIVQPAFHHDAVAQMREAITHAIHATSDRWAAQPNLDIESEMMRMSLEIVGSTLFSADLGAEAVELSRATLLALDAVVSLSQRPWISALHLPSRASRHLQKSLVQLDAAVAALIDHRLQHPVKRWDMLEMLIQAHGVSDGNAVPKAVRDEIVTFIVAGHETVASGLTWAWQLLMAHPTHYETLARTDSADLTFARAVFEETLRLYPPAWLITRRSTEADVLSGCEIPRGALIIMSPWIVHRDATWWPEPERFDPQRFLVADDARRMAYLPFGIGQRMCIGREMAMLEGALALSTLARQFRLVPTGVGEVGRVASVTLRPATHITATALPR